MRVRIDKDVAKKVAASAKKNGRSHAREVAIALSVYYDREKAMEKWPMQTAQQIIAKAP